MPVNFTRLVGLALVTLIGWREVSAEPPYTYPDVSKRFVGVQVTTKEEAQKRFTFSRQPARKGVFVVSVVPGAAVDDVTVGSVITKVGGKAVDTPEEFVEAVQSAPADLPIDIDVLRSMVNPKKQLYWLSSKKIQAKPMTYGSWTTELTTRTKDNFLNEWIEMQSDLIQGLPSSDLRLSIELVKNDIGKLYWSISYRGDFWIFVESISIRVGDAMHKFDVKAVRTVLNDASVLETCSAAADDKALNMIRDVAFGTGEVAVAFNGRSKTVAEPMSENGRMLFQLMALSYMERGGKGLENPAPAAAEKK